MLLVISWRQGFCWCLYHICRTPERGREGWNSWPGASGACDVARGVLEGVHGAGMMGTVHAVSAWC